jgi:hypothetical protein
MSLLPRDDAVRYPAHVKGALGIPAYLLGYLVVFLWKGGQVTRALQSVTIPQEDPPNTLAQYLASQGVSLPAWKGAGWLFYDAHFVPMNGVSSSLIDSAGGTFMLLYLVPPVVLTAAGALAACGSQGRTIWHTAYAGALIFLGYFPLALFATFAFGVSADVFIQPSVFYAIPIAGVVYPVIFGALGGAIEHEAHKRRATQETGVAGS